MEAAARRRPAHAGARVPAHLLRLASDDRLVELVRSGSEPAFEAMFDRHHRGVLAFCRHMLGSPHEAEDAVQHTFLAAYRDLAGSRKAILLRPWLYTIARNRCLSVLRARREQPVDELESLSTEHLSVAVQRRQDLRDLLRDVSGLPDDQRAALVLAEVGDASHAEIADVLGVRREKVKALVFQARSSLIASRDARETPCADIRTQLAELRGGALRRTPLRRHLRECPGCREFRTALDEQRRMLALALPVVPSVALKGGAMAAALGAGGAVAGGSAGTAVTAKVLVVAALAGGGAAGVGAVTADHPAPGPAPEQRRGGGAAPPAAAARPAAVTEAQEAALAPPARGRGQRRSASRRTGAARPPAKRRLAAVPAPAAAPRVAPAAPPQGAPAAGSTPAAPRTPGAKPPKVEKPPQPGQPVKAPKPAQPVKAPQPPKPAKPGTPPAASDAAPAVPDAPPAPAPTDGNDGHAGTGQPGDGASDVTAGLGGGGD